MIVVVVVAVAVAVVVVVGRGLVCTGSWYCSRSRHESVAPVRGAGPGRGGV